MREYPYYQYDLNIFITSSGLKLLGNIVKERVNQAYSNMSWALHRAFLLSILGQNLGLGLK